MRPQTLRKKPVASLRYALYSALRDAAYDAGWGPTFHGNTSPEMIATLLPRLRRAVKAKAGDLERLRGFGTKSLAAVEAWLHSHGVLTHG